MERVLDLIHQALLHRRGSSSGLLIGDTGSLRDWVLGNVTLTSGEGGGAMRTGRMVLELAVGVGIRTGRATETLATRKVLVRGTELPKSAR